jgi:hypothetical protein
MADKKGQILIRFPEKVANTLREVSFTFNIPINKLVTAMVVENIDKWKERLSLADIGNFIATESEPYNPDTKEEFQNAFIELSKKIKDVNTFYKYLYQRLTQDDPHFASLLKPYQEAPNPSKPD